MKEAFSLIYIIWFLRLFKPEWILAYYVPGIGFIRGLPTLFLYLLLLYVVFVRGQKLRVDKSFFIFFLSIAVSTIFAMNTGRARQGFFGMVDTLIFFALNVALIRDDKEIERIFNIYVAAMVFYAIVGMAYKGGGGGAIVPFHVALSDEDAFGPFMGLGAPLGLMLSAKDGKIRYGYLCVGLLCTMGMIASFARGAFVSFCAMLVFIWYRSNRKMLLAGIGVVFVFFFLIGATLLFDGGRYWEEMATIDDSLVDESTEGRHFLNRKAFQIFSHNIQNTLIGVGPFNFGHALVAVTTDQEAQARGVQLGQLYGRDTHNVYLQILSEQGSIGVITFAVMIGAFWRKGNTIIKKYRRVLGHSSPHYKGEENLVLRLRKHHYFAYALQGAMVAFLMNGLFYNILYYHWLFDLLILNYLVYENGRIAFPSEKPVRIREQVYA